MMFVFAWFAVGGITAFFSMFSVIAVAYGAWQLPWYAVFLVGGAFMFGMSMVQFHAMSDFHEWSNRLSANVSEPSRQTMSGLQVNAMVVSETASPQKEWINLSDINPGPIRHEALSEEDMARLCRLHSRLHPIDGWSLEYRVDLFKRDTNPGREISICERIADICYQAYSKFGPFTQEQRRDILALVSGACGAPDDEFLKRNPPRCITLSQAEQILALKA
ncbi:MAG: hypothetical protein GDA67_01615 [Nitrospira sp. CR1.3]|nr:hypothetical protein [Nitrospira sp. CR1.3]